MSENRKNLKSREKFLESLGATNGIQSAWCWANRNERFIVFGLFDDNCDENGQLILSDEWKLNKSKRIASQYSNAVRHINHIVEDGYALKILPQINDKEYSKLHGTAKVKYYYEILHDADLRIDNGKYYADTNYSIHAISQARSTLNTLDLYFAEILFPILVELAQSGETATYQELVREVKRRHPDSEAANNLIDVKVGSRLGAVWSFIREHNCPHIGALIINKTTGKVGSGFPKNLDPKLEKLKCFDYDWAPLLEIFPSFISGEKTIQKIESKKRSRRKRQEANVLFSKYYLDRKTEFENVFIRSEILKLKTKFEEKVTLGFHPGEAFANIMMDALDKGIVNHRSEGPEHVYIGHYVDADSSEPLFGYLKIGSSRDPEQRAKSLVGNVKSPLEFKMLRTWAVETGRSLLIEKWLHAYFADINYKGEFFYDNENGLLNATNSIIHSRWSEYLKL